MFFQKDEKISLGQDLLLDIWTSVGALECWQGTPLNLCNAFKNEKLLDTLFLFSEQILILFLKKYILAS